MKITYIHSWQVSCFQQNNCQSTGCWLPAKWNEKFTTSLWLNLMEKLWSLRWKYFHFTKSHLQASWLNLTTQSDLLILNLTQIDCIEWTDDLTYDIVSRIPIEAEHDKMQWHRLEFSDCETVKCKIFFIDWISCVSHDSGRRRRKFIIFDLKDSSRSCCPLSKLKSFFVYSSFVGKFRNLNYGKRNIKYLFSDALSTKKNHQNSVEWNWNILPFLKIRIMEDVIWDQFEHTAQLELEFHCDGRIKICSKSRT